MLPRFYAPHAREANQDLDLSPEESRHATRVLRLREGDELAVFDGSGREWSGRVLKIGRDIVRVRLVTAVPAVPEARVAVTLLQAVLKGDHMDAVVRDATMLGVRAIRPVVTTHTVAHATAASGPKAADRWTRVAIASAKQCRRAVVPVVEAARPLGDGLDGIEAGARIVLAEPAVAGSVHAAPGDVPESAVLAVGPEGGWSADELRWFADHGFQPLTLGTLTLRADAAALVALSVLRERWKDL